MSTLDRVAAGVELLGITRLLPAQGPLVLMYHGLGGDDGVAPRALVDQLDLVATRRRVVSLAEAVEAIGRPEAAELAAITFDDAYRDFVALGLPALAHRGLHATVFAPAGWMGRHNAWDEGRATRRDILSADELRTLDPTTVEVGAHGLTHTRLAGLVPAALEAETRGARERLEDSVGRPVRLFAYPFGQRDDFDAVAERAVARAGYTAACSTCFGRSSDVRERFRLRRVGIEPGDDLARVARKLDGAYDWLRWKEIAGFGLRRFGLAR